MATTTKKIEPSVVQRNPNAFMGFTTIAMTSGLIYTAQVRLGIELSEFEAGFIVAIVTSVVLFLGKRIPDGPES